MPRTTNEPSPQNDADIERSYRALDAPARTTLLALAACAQMTNADMVARVLSEAEMLGGFVGAGEVGPLLAHLAEVRLVERAGLDGRLWTLHDAVRRFVRAQDGAGQLDAAHRSVAEQIAGAPDGETTKEAMSEVLTAIDRLLNAGPTDDAMALLAIAHTDLYEQGRTAELLERYERFLGLLPAGSETPAEMLGRAGFCAMEVGEYARAIAHYRRDLAVCERLDDREAQSRTLGSLGICHHELSDHAEAITCLERALAMDESSGNEAEQAWKRGLLGICYKDIGDVPRAIDQLKRSVALFEEHDQLKGQAVNHCNLIDCYLDQGHLSLVANHADQALSLYRRMGFPEQDPRVTALIDMLAELRSSR